MTATTNTGKIPYYQDNTRISNSNLGQYIKYGPKYLKGMLDGTQEGLSGAFLDKGTMIHKYILEPNDFWNDYEILEYEVPRSKQQKDFCEFWSKSIEIEPDKRALTAYRKAYSNTKSDKLALQEAEDILVANSEYTKALETEKSGKKAISWGDIAMLKEVKKNLEDHKKANELLYNLPDTCDTQNEFHINWEYPTSGKTYQIPCKSLLDRLIIDHETKKIILVDLKTTADVNNFAHSMKEYDYYRQLAYYWAALHWYFKYELQLEIKDYTYDSYIIAIQNNNGYAVRVFNITPESIEDRLDTITETINKIAWHKANNLWDYSREYYDGDGAELLAT